MSRYRGVKSLGAAVCFAFGVGVAGSAAAETLSIGAIGPLTGPGSAWGLALAGGAKFAAQEINAKGGLKVGNKVYEVKIIAYDEQYKATEAVAAFNRLVSQDGVKFIVGPLSSSGTLAVKNLVEENKTIIFTGAYSSKAIDQSSKFLFRAYSTPTEYIDPMVKWLKQNQTAAKNRVVLLNPNDETGWDATRLQEGSYKGNGFNVVAKELYERSVKDFQPLLTKVLAAKPDVVELGTSSPATAGLIVRQARELGYKGRFIKIGGPGPREIIAGAGKENAEGVLNYMLTDPASAAHKRLAEEYKKAYGHDMNDLLPAWYDATRVLLAAIQKAGTVTDTDKVRQAIAQVMPFKAALGGELTLSGKANYGVDTQLLTVSYVGEIRNGETVILGVAK